MRKKSQIMVAFVCGELTGKGYEGVFWSDGHT